VVLATGFVVVFVCLTGVALGAYGLHTWHQIDRVKGLHIAAAPPGEPINVLLVGSDSREGEYDESAVSGKRTDTILVLRVDPRSEQVTALSFPRDLVLQVAGQNRRGMINAIYNAPGKQQALIDTIQQDFGIAINHWVEVDFQGFRQLVDAIDGVTLYIPYPLRDIKSGFQIDQTGCVTLNGDEALGYARSRTIQYQVDGHWRTDPLSDLSRITRQQALMGEALRRALDRSQRNPIALQYTVAIGANNVSVDDTMGFDDMVDLLDQFRDFDTNRFVTLTLPNVPDPDASGRLLVDDAAAEPILNLFRGLDPSEVGPGNVDVTVVNGTAAGAPEQQRPTLATDVSGALHQVGFVVEQPADAGTFYANSVIQYAPGELNRAQGLARYVTGGVALAETPEVAPGHVTLIAGADFTTVHDQPTPIAELPAPPGVAPTTTTTLAPGGAAPTTSLPPPVTFGTTTTLPAQSGAIPPGACG
jgi:LCP family protein required for cell wall assembly